MPNPVKKTRTGQRNPGTMDLQAGACSGVGPARVSVYGRVNARPPGRKNKDPASGSAGRGMFRSGPGATRTRDLLLRRQALYPTELRTRIMRGSWPPGPFFATTGEQLKRALQFEGA